MMRLWSRRCTSFGAQHSLAVLRVNASKGKQKNGLSLSWGAPCVFPTHSSRACLCQHSVASRCFGAGKSLMRGAPSLDVSSTDRVRIGHVEKEVPSTTSDIFAKSRHLIPYGFLPDTPSQSVLSHLQWMLAKDSLKQDMLLVGPPGSGSQYRRSLALMFAEMTRQPVEILTLSSDITESDLKQRRELVHDDSGTAMVRFVDQAPVRAAIHGRILILDGLHKVERNVLPTLNNLLENREMHLEDGRLLVSPQRFAELSRDNTIEASSFLVPTSDNFRVIALGVPAPPYDGHSLDPPLRSRFQIRRVDNLPAEEMYAALRRNGLSATNSKLGASFYQAMETASMNLSGVRSLHFPSSALMSISKVMEYFPLESFRSLLERAYPVAHRHCIGQQNYEQSLKSFVRACNALNFDGASSSNQYEIVNVSPISTVPFQAEVLFSCKSPSSFEDESTFSDVSIIVPSGGGTTRPISDCFVQTISSKLVLKSMMQEHYANRDFVLTSPKGQGKSVIAKEFASILGYDVHLFPLFKDMTGRDLLMRRTANASTGNTGWADSPLITAAKDGHICILDGVDTMNSDALETLHSLLTDREQYLPDGTRLIEKDRVVFGSQLAIPIHPSFRVIGLASVSRDRRGSWLSEELMNMFAFIDLPLPSSECLKNILMTNVPACPTDVVQKVLSFHANLTDAAAAECGVQPLSIRTLLRVLKCATAGNNLYDCIRSLLVAELLPASKQSALKSILKRSGIVADGVLDKLSSEQTHVESGMLVNDDMVSFGDFVIKRKALGRRPEMIPSPLFFDIPSHIRLIKRLLFEWTAGERAFLLLGNQGVGKNKIVDRICHIAKWEREYIQLHRDSTINQLTLSPSFEYGKIVWNDSPLVRAVQEGCALVIDEADKAPVEVIAVLKCLVEDGELLLADGRRISRNSSGSGIIDIHSDFTVWVLANRPGYPFQGNDFFRIVGDCFSTHVIANPDFQSEVNLLKSYAPNTDLETLRQIAASFGDLRRLFEAGDLSYPYSTREAVGVVKHLEKYPTDDLASVLNNVLDFDSFDERLYKQIWDVFHGHGLKMSEYASRRSGHAFSNGGKPGNLRLQIISDRQNDGESKEPPALKAPKVGKWDDENEAHVGGNQWAGGTGGSDTAGLGGRGGPYRLDRGHQVHQVSDKAKAEVSIQAAAAAQKIAKTALKDRLSEIGMSEEEWKSYDSFLEPIRRDIANLRGTLHSVTSKQSERNWIKRQSHGEIDDSKLVDGIAGDKFIFKKRGNVETHYNNDLKRPKRLRFVMDCSGSMYRFNGYDQRLDRALEAAALIMESFDGMDQRFDYSIVGHSGDSRCIELVNFGKPPLNAKERMRILQTMVAHTQFCQSGDNTIGAIEQAMIDVNIASSGDTNTKDSVVIAVSDDNLARYGIRPKELAESMTVKSGYAMGAQQKAYCIFIASFGREADDIISALPLGRGFVCKNTSLLPKVVRDILMVELA